MTKPVKILFITVRADFGGGPEHVYRLIDILTPEIEAFVACPKDYPYWDRYQKLLGSDHMIEIPHRKFAVLRLVYLLRYVRCKGIELIHSHGKGAGAYGRILAFLTRKPCVHTFHGVHIGKYSEVSKRLY